MSGYVATADTGEGGRDVRGETQSGEVAAPVGDGVGVHRMDRHDTGQRLEQPSPRTQKENKISNNRCEPQAT